MMIAITYLQVFSLLICSLAIINSASCAKENASHSKDYQKDIDQYLVEKTIVQNAVSKGAVCLDGSSPAYHFEPGFEEGTGNWIVQLSGGEWCTSVEDCLDRSKGDHGSSKFMGPFLFKGIYSKNQRANPDFCNWNKVLVNYCDGGAFTGDVEYIDPATNLHFRGARIFDAVMEDVLAKGLKNARNVVLIGSSAGGYPAMLYCDRFHKLLPNTPRVKCMVDSGYFIHVKDPQHARGFEKIYSSLVTLHGAAKALPKSCTAKMKPELCFFPENMQQDIKTPLFIAMSAFDKYQIKTSIAGHINLCIEVGNCTARLNKALREFRSEFINALPKANNPKLRGVFIDSANHHTQVLARWSNATVVAKINNLVMRLIYLNFMQTMAYGYEGYVIGCPSNDILLKDGCLIEEYIVEVSLDPHWRSSNCFTIIFMSLYSNLEDKVLIEDGGNVMNGVILVDPLWELTYFIWDTG